MRSNVSKRSRKRNCSLSPSEQIMPRMIEGDDLDVEANLKEAAGREKSGVYMRKKARRKRKSRTRGSSEWIRYTRKDH